MPWLELALTASRYASVTLKPVMKLARPDVEVRKNIFMSKTKFEPADPLVSSVSTHQGMRNSDPSFLFSATRIVTEISRKMKERRN